jgi:molybdopterin-guanine dinucleotide biosynthesis protein A
MGDGVPSRETVTGVILAGGMGRRMGGLDKGLVPFAGRPLVEWVIAALRPQVRALVVNANRNRDAYAAYGHPVVGDPMEGFQGPLAGIAGAMAVVTTPWLVTAPCDGPFLPPDLVKRLSRALVRDEAEIAVVDDGQRIQPVYALLPVALAASLRAFLSAGERKVDRWYASHRVAVADFSDHSAGFANINSLQDSARLEQGLTP